MAYYAPQASTPLLPITEIFVKGNKQTRQIRMATDMVKISDSKGNKRQKF